MSSSANQTNQPKNYTVCVRAGFLSTLSLAELERRIVLALFDEASGFTTPEGASEEFQILDYEFSKVSELPDEQEEPGR